MYVLGKTQWQGKEKDIVLKEEDGFFKYYSLELIGAYVPKLKEHKIIFAKNIALSQENKRQIMQLLNEKLTKELLLLLEKNNCQPLGNIQIENNTKKEVVIRKEQGILKYYYLNLIGVYTPKMPGQTIIFREDTLENKVLASHKDIKQKDKISSIEKQQLQYFLESYKVKELLNSLQKNQQKMRQRDSYNKTQQTNKTKESKQEQTKTNQKENLQKQQIQPQKKQNTVKDINIKQEVDMDTRVTDMSNLEQTLQKEGKISRISPWR